MDDELDGLRLALARAALATVAPSRLVAAAGCIAPQKLLDPKVCQAAGWSTNAVRDLLDAAPECEAEARSWRDAGWQLVSPGDPGFPPLLAQIADAPPVLWVYGGIERLHQPQIALVGTRNPSADGRANARSLGHSLARAGFCVTSGLALGIDGQAHAAAVEAGGTIAVMGSGPDRIYPARHSELARRIGETGALVTEFPPGVAPRAHHFPRRNRIISGLSLATVVVEAAPRSGSLITARLAAEQGRDVFAVPGSIHNPQSRGCHNLLRDGAILLESIDDIGAHLDTARALADTVTPDAETREPDDPVLGAFTGGVNSLDSLHERTGLHSAELTQQLAQLEIAGEIERLPGGYQRIR